MNKNLIQLILILVIAVVAYLAIDHKVAASWQNTVAQYDDKLLDEIAENREKLNQLVVDLELAQKATQQQSNAINSVLNKLKDGAQVVNIDSGEVAISNKTMPSLSEPDGCEANRGLVKSQIQFNQKFELPPQVFVSFTKFDFWHGQDHRLVATTANVTAEGFELDFRTWCDTRMSQAQLSWVAIGL